eukprot:9839017-Ditylum_brightwellii.AAC.1
MTVNVEKQQKLLGNADKNNTILSWQQKGRDVEVYLSEPTGPVWLFEHTKHAIPSSPEFFCPVTKSPISVCSGITLEYFVGDDTWYKDKDAMQAGLIMAWEQPLVTTFPCHCAL